MRVRVRVRVRLLSGLGTCGLGRQRSVLSSQNALAPPWSAAHGRGEAKEWKRYQSVHATMML